MHKKYNVTIRVKPNLLPNEDQIYIVGNHELLGAWQAQKLPLVPDKDGDGYWSRTFTFKANAEIEYKFTRGSWDTEAVDKDGNALKNHHLVVKKDTVITNEIHNWRDVAAKEAHKTIATRITGTVKFHHDIAANGLTPREIIVWLPPDYEKNKKKRYPVIYMHDGQNIFDSMTSYTGVDWRADETATELIKSKKMPAVIIVGIYNTAERIEEYSASSIGKKYRSFVCKTVKPLIDKTYRTKPEREFTATIGSSMGGLVSFLLAWLHPETFGVASCLSPSFIIRKNQAIKYIRRCKNPRQPVRIYMDCGGVGGERLLYKGCKQIVMILRKKGFRIGKVIYFSYYRQARHSESDWADRLDKHFTFMFRHLKNLD